MKPPPVGDLSQRPPLTEAQQRAEVRRPVVHRLVVPGVPTAAQIIAGGRAPRCGAQGWTVGSTLDRFVTCEACEA